PSPLTLVMATPCSLALFMRRMLSAEAAVLAELQPLRGLLLVLRRAVVAPLTFGARQRNDVSHDKSPVRLQTSGFSLQPEPEARSPEPYSMISVTVPAPTVRPPSRMGNRPPACGAQGP